MNKNQLAMYENIALSNIDIKKLLNDRNSIVLYPDLHKYTDIDEMLGPYGMCVLLIESHKSYGHWVCIFKHKPDTITFFNSYGGINSGYPDESLKLINKTFAAENNEDYPYLSKLLLNSPYKLTYNNYVFQASKKGIKTCGRHCVVRLLCYNMDDDQYYKYVISNCKKYKLTPDQFVTLLTI